MTECVITWQAGGFWMSALLQAVQEQRFYSIPVRGGKEKASLTANSHQSSQQILLWTCTLYFLPEVWSISCDKQPSAFSRWCVALVLSLSLNWMIPSVAGFRTNARHMPRISDWLEIGATRWIITPEPSSGLWQVPVLSRQHKQLDSSRRRSTGRQGGEASCVDKRCTQKRKLKEDTLSLILAVCATLCEHRCSFPRSDTAKPQQSHHCVLPQSNISLGLSGAILATLFSGSPLYSSTRRCYPFAARAILSLQRRGNTEVSAPIIDRPVFTSLLFLVGGSQQRYKSMKTRRSTTTTTKKVHSMNSNPTLSSKIWLLWHCQPFDRQQRKNFISLYVVRKQQQDALCMRIYSSCEASKTPHFSLFEEPNAEDSPKHMNTEIYSTMATNMPVSLMFLFTVHVCVCGPGCYGYPFLWISLQADK